MRRTHDQIYVDCIMGYYPSVTAEQISSWDNEEVMRCLLDIANDHFMVGYMTNDDGRAYGTRYSSELPDACWIALRWAETSTDQSSRGWSQWTTREV